MAANYEIFDMFYKSCSRKEIKKAYGALGQSSIFSALFKKNPFPVEIRMKDAVFAMQMRSEIPVSMELITVIGFYFDKFNREKNCVYTKNEDNIKTFFTNGIEEFIEYGGRIKYSLSDDEKRKIIDLCLGVSCDDELRSRIAESFDALETKSLLKHTSEVRLSIEQEKEASRIKEITCMDLPMDFENCFASDTRAAGVIAESSTDGLILSLSNLGRVDIEYIAQITGKSLKEVISDLKGSIYQNPETWDECFYKGWETADEYLSGHVTDKWNKAKSADKKYNGYFNANVKALEAIIPASVGTDNIYVTLGSPWVPPDIIDAFIRYAFAVPEGNTVYNEDTGIWKIPFKSRYKNNYNAEHVYGTKRLNAVYILERTLNMKKIGVYDEVPSSSAASGFKRVLNNEETMLALEMQRKMINDFKSWVWSDDNRRNRLQEIYEMKFCSSVIRRYDGSFLSFPGKHPAIRLYDHQKNAVARILFSPNTLLAHEVGAGKTYVLAAAGMELRRIGLSKKNMYVVPNNIVGQWKQMFLRLYPKANIFCIDPKSFQRSKRQKILSDIKYADFDAVIIAYSCFELIPSSKKKYIEELTMRLKGLQKTKDKKSRAISAQTDNTAEIAEISEKLAKVIKDEYNILYFEDLGINTLFVDEAHNFKNVPIKTNIKNVLGISPTGSAKCQDMMDKVNIVQKQNNGKGVVFATGTPITNSLTDIFVMQKYLQDGELTLLGLQNFDSWVGMFAEYDQEFEVDVDTSRFRLATRFSKFNNMPELANILAGIADFYAVDKSDGIPQKDGYSDVVIPQTKKLAAYLSDLSDRADKIRKGYVRMSDDNMLKVTSDGRLAALDVRLADDTAVFEYQSKVAYCAENVFDIYQKTSGRSLTQLVFCDVSTPKEEFNIYDELKELLIKQGIPSEKIAFVHDAKTEKKRDKLFEKVRQGEIRVLIGSTLKLGLGVNVQDRLIALHHIDVPWRPSDMIQREGRILRKGNKNPKIYIYRYITEGSFDAYSWQLLETKQKTINAVLSGCMPQRMCEEVADTVLSYAEVKAISIGNPLLKERVETANELSKTINLQRKLMEARNLSKIELEAIPDRIKSLEAAIENCKEDITFIKEYKKTEDKKTRGKFRAHIYGAIQKNELSTKETKICTYRGFDIIAPANMTLLKPFIYLQRRGRYIAHIGMSERGVLVRIDNILENLSEHEKELSANLKRLHGRERDIKEDLGKDTDHSKEIEKLSAKLKAIDERLGLKK